MGFLFPVYANFFVEWKEGFFIYFLIGCIIAGITVGVVSYTFVKVILVKELLKVSDIAKQISNKNISVGIDIESNDAVGEIANGFNEVIEKLNIFVNDTRKITSEVHVIGGKNGNDIGEMQVLNNSIDDVKENTRNISLLSDKIRNEVLQIQTAVQKSNKELLNIDQTVIEFSEQIKLLVGQTEEIQKITGVVNDVALQTNLLALNASIEASKAGESGKSFSVVASEVRGLSGDISNSVVQITKITNSLIENLESANSLNRIIADRFESSINESKKFAEIVEKVDDYTISNIHENETLNSSIVQLNKILSKMNSTFESFYNSVSTMNSVVIEYQTK